MSDNLQNTSTQAETTPVNSQTPQPLNPPPVNSTPVATVNLGEQPIVSPIPLNSMPNTNTPVATIQETIQPKPVLPTTDNGVIQKSLGETNSTEN